MRLASLIALSLCLSACGDIEPGKKLDEGPKSQHYVAEGWVAKTLPDISKALESGDLSAAELTKTYLTRIDAVDKNGPKLQSVLSINPDAMAQAEASDARRVRGCLLYTSDRCRRRG